jgi:hypothetical protein
MAQNYGWKSHIEIESQQNLKINNLFNQISIQSPEKLLEFLCNFFHVSKYSIVNEFLCALFKTSALYFTISLSD